MSKQAKAEQAKPESDRAGDDHASTCISCALFATFDRVAAARGTPSLPAQETMMALGNVIGNIIASAKMWGKDGRYFDDLSRVLNEGIVNGERMTMQPNNSAGRVH